ncbi:unnamed protein product, partial [marine sediment metagenome]
MNACRRAARLWQVLANCGTEAFDMNSEMSRSNRVAAIVSTSNHVLVVAFLIVITA